VDPIKVIIFVAAFVLLLLLGRKLSGTGNSHGFPAPPEGPELTADAPAMEPAAASLSRVTGADMPFPIKLPEIECNQDGRYNRPEFLNYYFENTDLKNGPPDPTSFCDDFYVMARDVESRHQNLYQYLVATPAGLQAALAAERLPALYIEGQLILVPRWDLHLILDTVVKQIMKDYAEPDEKETHALPDEDS
jgi:hypothetical protein